MKRLRLRRRTLMAVGITLLLGPAACSSGSRPDGAIVFDLEAVMAQPWTATGEFVDAGLMCPEGSRRSIGLFDLSGARLTFPDLMVLIDAAEAEGLPPSEAGFMAEMEWTCVDGSGSFRTMDDGGGEGAWKVVGGTGAYVGLSGDGSYTLQTAPPPSSPDDPPEGELVRATATGTLEMGDFDR